MANFLDNIKRITGFEPEDDFDDYDLDLEEEFEEEEEEDIAPVRQQAAADPKGQPRRGNVVNMPSKTTMQVVLAKPERFDDASAIADHLNEKRTVVLNLEAANRDVSRRLIDFLSGVAYANAGQLKRVANSTFIITPFNVNVTGDLLDELENSGVFFTGQQS
ncbi:MAG: cell division protein SepF [Clostridia bacterium]|nr:cell division protein SepF [Clostridia bacterium]